MPANSPAKPPRFVLSYSRRDRDKWLDKFFKDLRREIAIREGLEDKPDNSEPGYRDVDAIPGGADWSDDLAGALARSWACVSLYTPSYFKREACGKEVQVFLDRARVRYTTDGAAQGAKGILPVLWASQDDLVRHGMPPGVVSRINFRATKHHQRYEREGLRWILQRSPRAAYLDILYDIVKDLITNFGDKPDELDSPPDFKRVKNAFGAVRRPASAANSKTGGPDSLAIYLIVAAGGSGLFSPTGAESWLSLLEEEDSHLQIDARFVDPAEVRPPSLLTLLEESTQQNGIVFVIVDPTTAKDHPTEVIALLNHVVEAKDWAGTIITPGDDTNEASRAVHEQVTVPPQSADRISLHSVDKGEDALAETIRSLQLDERKRVVADGVVKRRAPGGGKPADKPRLKGPAEPRMYD